MQGNLTFKFNATICGLVDSGAPMGRALVDFGRYDKFIVNYNGDWRSCVVNRFSAGSSRTLKKDIEDMSLETAEEVLDALYPRTFRYKNGEDEQRRLGCIEEESLDAVTESGKQGVFLEVSWRR